MQFNPTDTTQSIVALADEWVNTSTSSYPLAQKALHANVYMQRVTNIILESNDSIQWDDINHPDGNVLFFDLKSGERKYTIFQDENGKDLLQIQKLLVKDSNGKWQILTPYDFGDPEAEDILTGNGGSGVPEKYDWQGKFLRFDKEPNYASSQGVQIVFQREPTYFSASDTTKEPGFNADFHYLVAFWMAYSYASRKGMAVANTLRQEIEQGEERLRNRYRQRSREKNKQLYAEFEEIE